MSQELIGLLKKRIQIAQIVWGGLSFSVVMYVFVAFSAKTGGSTSPYDLTNALSSPMAQVCAAVAFMMCFVQFFVSKVLMPSSANMQMPENLGEAMRALRGRSGQRIWSDKEVDVASKLNPDEARILYCFSRWFISFIIGMALSESVVVFGLVVAFVQGPPSIILPFAGITLTLFTMRFPSVSGYLQQVDSSKKVI